MKPEQKTWVTRAELIAEANALRRHLGLLPLSHSSHGNLWEKLVRRRVPCAERRFEYHRESSLARLIQRRPSKAPIHRKAFQKELKTGNLVIVSDACRALGVPASRIYAALSALSVKGFRHPVSNVVMIDVWDFLRVAFFRQRAFIRKYCTAEQAQHIFESRPWVTIADNTSYSKKLYFSPELVRAGSRSHPLPQPHQKTSTQK